MPPPDPVLQAAIDQDFRPVPLALGSDGTIAVCEPHKLEKCDNCNVDFVNTNRLSRLLVANPNLLCPPPSNIVSQKLTQMVTSAKEEGNVSTTLASQI
jgi:translocation protein SEC72